MHTNLTDLDSGTSSAIRTDPVAAQEWQARLSLQFAQQRGGTVLTHRAHHGPLRVQRPFYPEGAHGPCHVYVLHPPGGVVSGDALQLDVHLGEQTRTLLTAPGANKLYRARKDASASFHHRFVVGAKAQLEWLPHETIAFSGTRAELHTEVELADDACYVGWEIVCLGRPACGERFEQGELKTDLVIRRAGQLAYLERARYRAGDAMLTAPWGMNGQSVLATMIVAAPHAEASWVEALREHFSEHVTAENDGGTFAVTLVSGILIARYLGGSTRQARALFERAYHVLRPLYASLNAVHPRIWST